MLCSFNFFINFSALFNLSKACDDSLDFSFVKKMLYMGGTAAAAPPPFRPSEPALCGSHPLVTPYYCRLGDLLCFVFIVRLVYFSVIDVCVPSVLWYCWLGLLTCKNRLLYNLLCWLGRKTLLHPSMLYMIKSRPSASAHSDSSGCDVRQAIPLAMATLRNVHNICPAEVHQFLLNLFKYNDNSKNKVPLYFTSVINNKLILNNNL